MRFRTDARHRRPAALLVALATLGVAPVHTLAESPPALPEVATSPALVLLIAVDQLRRDRLDASLPGGLGRLAREGRVHVDAALDHATTETCPGHAAMLSGRHPGAMGVPGNSFIDRQSGERVYCVEDRAADAAVLGRAPDPDRDPTSGRSPRKLRFGGLGGWMKAGRPSTRVFSVSGKDRAAIAMTGLDGDAAYWVDVESGGFTTSRYYRETLPAWVVEWNAAAGSALPEHWTHGAVGARVGDVERPDDFAGESDEYSRTSPHPLHDPDPEEQADRVRTSPYLDALTLDFARTLVERESLGTEAGPDLLAVSLSATDIIGHAYGPSSAESRDALARLDRDLGAFLAFLEDRLGGGRVLVALTADHGVLPLPEWLGATDASECPVDGGRQGLIGFAASLFFEMHVELSPFAWPGLWFDYASQLTVNRQRAAAQDVPVERAIAVAERWLEAQPVVREAWTESEIQTADSPVAALYRNAFDPERSGDIALQLEPGCLIDFRGAGTTHGSAYPYDREVPVVFFGPGVPAGRVAGPAAVVDIGPTLAGRLGVPLPAGLDGRDLFDAGGGPIAQDAGAGSLPSSGSSGEAARNTSGSM